MGQQSCMFNYVTDQDTYVDIITCIEDSADITSDDTVKKCLTDSFVPVETIQNIITCWEGDEGIQLHHENGVKTEQLVPPHEYVPWVTFNDSILKMIHLCTAKMIYVAAFAMITLWT